MAPEETFLPAELAMLLRETAKLIIGPMAIHLGQAETGASVVVRIRTLADHLGMVEMDILEMADILRLHQVLFDTDVLML